MEPADVYGRNDFEEKITSSRHIGIRTDSTPTLQLLANLGKLRLKRVIACLLRTAGAGTWLQFEPPKQFKNDQYKTIHRTAVHFLDIARLWKQRTKAA